jgi:hypothetical protein
VLGFVGGVEQAHAAVSGLTALDQAIYGALGGAIVMISKVRGYLLALNPGGLKDIPFRDRCLAVCWVFFPIASAALARAAEEHTVLLAMFEGASLPSLFFTFAHHYEQPHHAAELATVRPSSVPVPPARKFGSGGTAE